MTTNTTANNQARAARVVQSFGDHGWAVLSDNDNDNRIAPATFEPIHIHFRRSVGRCLPGDHVLLGDQQDVLEIIPRSNCFGRGRTNGQYQPIAANLDTLLIVIAAEPAPSPDLLHRYIAAARIQDIQPVIVVNKSDLNLPDQAPFNQLHEMGLPVHHVQCKPNLDLAELESIIDSGTHLLAGQSGVGKSSITNALLPDLELQTQALSDATGKGKHTTTTATLHPLANGGWLVDTPGVWEYGLWSMPSKTLELGFPEFYGLSERCRFRDCRHDHEPSCAVRAAVERGEISAFRHQAWLQLLAEQQRISK